MIELNRKILGIAVVLLAVAMLATPVFAKPTKGQKAEISLAYTYIGPGGGSSTETGNVIHRSATLYWAVEIEINDVPAYSGIVSATTERKLLRVHREEGIEFRILNDYYVLEFDGVDGTFEGNALLQTDWSIEGQAYRYTRVCHALLKGTGVFKGQTINAQQDWTAQDQLAEWTGYILKP